MKKERKDEERDQAQHAAKRTGPRCESGARPGIDLGIGMVDLIHEIRNPLNGMDTTLQLMARHLSRVGGYEDPVLVSYVQGLKKEIHRIHTILLDIQMLWRGDLELRPVIMGNRMIDEVLKTDGVNYAGCGIQIANKVPDRLPAVLTNDKMLKRALCNLIKNAVEAMPRGGTLTLQTHSREESVVVEIVDTGVGISEDGKVFSPFATSKPGGMGLGLNIVQRIMSVLGGEIDYSSEPGKGTTFRLSLPRC